MSAHHWTRRTFIGNAGAAAAAGIGTVLASSIQGQDAAGSGKLKVIAVNCSPRAGKTTTRALEECLLGAAAVSDRIETELIELGGLSINGNVVAGIPLAEGEKDDFPAIAPRLAAENVIGIVIGTPVYFGNMTSLCKAFLERWMTFRQDGFLLSNKVAGVVTVGGSRNGGQELTLKSVQTALLSQEMLVVGDGRPRAHCGGTVWSGAPGGIEEDEYGLGSARSLGKRVAEVGLLIRG